MVVTENDLIFESLLDKYGKVGLQHQKGFVLLKNNFYSLYGQNLANTGLTVQGIDLSERTFLSFRFSFVRESGEKIFFQVAVFIVDEANKNVGITALPEISMSRIGLQHFPVTRSSFFGNNLDFKISTPATDKVVVRYRNKYDINFQGMPQDATILDLNMVSKVLGLVTVSTKDGSFIYTLKCQTYDDVNLVVSCLLGNVQMPLPTNAKVNKAWPLKSIRVTQEDEGFFWYEVTDESGYLSIQINYFNFSKIKFTRYKPASKTFKTL